MEHVLHGFVNWDRKLESLLYATVALSVSLVAGAALYLSDRDEPIAAAVPAPAAPEYTTPVASWSPPSTDMYSRFYREKMAAPIQELPPQF